MTALSKVHSHYQGVLGKASRTGKKKKDKTARIEKQHLGEEDKTEEKY